MKLFLLLILSALLLSCNQGQIEELKGDLEEARAELLVAKAEADDLKADMRKLQYNFRKFGFLANQLKNVRANIKTSFGNIEVKFYGELAPIHAFNFITRAESGFYDGLQFHRVMKGFMIQGGDPKSKDNNFDDDGQGGPLVNIPHEFNNTKHVPGVLSMARVPDKNAGAGSQFFIMHGTNKGLDGEYTAFGEVTKGMNVVNEIADTRVFGNANPRQPNHPVTAVRIFGVDVYRVSE